MQTYILQVRDRDGNDTWVRISASSRGDAIRKARGRGVTGTILGQDNPDKDDYIGDSTRDFLLRAGDSVISLSTANTGGEDFDPTAPAPAEPFTAGTSDDPGPTEQDFDRDRFFSEGSFLNAARELGLDPEGQFGGGIRRQFAPLQAASQLAGVVQGLPENQTLFQDFFEQNLGRGNQVAGNALRNLFQGNLSGQATAGARAGEFSNIDFTGQTPGDIGRANTLRDLSRSALTSRVGGFVGANLAPSQARVTRDLASINAAGGFGTGENPATFQDFLRGQFGLQF